jgi:hypothetical protein
MVQPATAASAARATVHRADRKGRAWLMGYQL